MTHPADAPEAPNPHLPLGRLMVIPPELEAEAVVGRMGHWNSSLKPWDLVECWNVQGISRETIHLERIHQQEILLRHAQAQRARVSWEEDRRGEVEALAAGLMKHPALVISQLRRTPQGCGFLAEQWETLRATAEARGEWSAPHRLLALNLLGVLPELRDAVTPLDAPAGVDPAAHLVAVAEAQVRRHRDLAEALAPVDATEREAARVGLGPDTPPLVALRKEERASDRRLAWCRSQFKSSRLDPRPPDSDNRPPWVPPRKSEPPADTAPDESAAAPAQDSASQRPPRAAPRRRRA